MRTIAVEFDHEASAVADLRASAIVNAQPPSTFPFCLPSIQADRDLTSRRGVTSQDGGLDRGSRGGWSRERVDRRHSSD